MLAKSPTRTHTVADGLPVSVCAVVYRWSVDLSAEFARELLLLLLLLLIHNARTN